MPDSSQFVSIPEDLGSVAPVTDVYVRKDVFESDVLEFLMKQPAYRNLVEDRKINWIADSKGGEPNCHREADAPEKEDACDPIITMSNGRKYGQYKRYNYAINEGRHTYAMIDDGEYLEFDSLDKLHAYIDSKAKN